MNKKTDSIIGFLQSNKIASSKKVHFIRSVGTEINDEMKLSIYNHLKSYKTNWAIKSSIFNLVLNNKKFCITNDLIIQIKSSKNWLTRLNAAKSLSNHGCCKNCDKYINNKKLINILINEPYPEVRKAVILVLKKSISTIDEQLLIEIKKNIIPNIISFLNSLHSRNNHSIDDKNLTMYHEIYLNFGELITFCDFLLEKNEVDSVFNIIAEVYSIFDNTSNIVLNKFLEEILDSSLISILLKTRYSNRSLLKKISSICSISKNIKDLSDWRFEQLKSNPKTDICFSVTKNSGYNKNQNFEINYDDYVDFSNCKKDIDLYEDFNIIDSNVRNKLDNVEPYFKIQAVAKIWGLKIKEHTSVKGSTGTLKISCSNKNKKYYLKNIGNSHQSAIFVCHFLSWLNDFAGFKVPDLIKTKRGKLCAKINEFYYSLEEEILEETDLNINNITYKSFYRLGLECGKFHNITKNYSPVAFKAERPISDPIQFEELIYFYEYLINLDDLETAQQEDHIQKFQFLKKIGLSDLGEIDVENLNPYIRLMLENHHLIIDQFYFLNENFNWKQYSKLDRKYIHFDFSWNNLVWSNEEIIQIYDWNKSGWMPFAEEVKNSVMNHGIGRKFDPLAILNFLDGYLNNSNFTKNDLAAILCTLKSTYIAAFHDHMHILKSREGNNLLFKRMCYNSIMFESFCDFFDEFQEILFNYYKEYFNDFVEITNSRDTNENHVKSKLINHMFKNINNANIKNSIKYISAIRQICTETDHKFICNSLEKLLLSKTDLSDEIKNEIIMCFYSLGDSDTIVFLDKLLLNGNFENQKYYILNCSKLILNRDKAFKKNTEIKISKLFSYFNEKN